MAATATAPTVPPRHFQLTLKQYQQMIESGVLTEEHKVELIPGQPIEKMPIISEHAATVRKLRQNFTKRFAGEYEISTENPVVPCIHSS